MMTVGLRGQFALVERDDTNWLGAVESGTAGTDLVGIVRAYLASWSAEDLALIPEPCRPATITTLEEIVDRAYTLARAHLESVGHGEENIPLEKITIFMTAAARRVVALASPTPRPTMTMFIRHQLERDLDLG